jgi:hypothetical protein
MSGKVKKERSKPFVKYSDALSEAAKFRNMGYKVEVISD